MSWLRDHFYTFVFPAMVSAGISDRGLPPMDVKAAESAPQNLPPELRKLWTLCHDLGVSWSDSIIEGGAGSSAFRASAKLHGAILRSTLASSVTAMRAEKCSKLFLAGRDVWALAVLAERKGVPYVFLPQISRSVASSDEVRTFLMEHGITGQELLIDTGFAGSIPMHLSICLGVQVPFRLMSQSPVSTFDFFARFSKRTKKGLESRPKQVFPNRKNARAEALETEYLAKYWQTGRIENGQVTQRLSTRDQIRGAAILTSRLWRGKD